MLLYKDEAFEDRWTTVPSLTLEDDIFVKVFMVNDRHRQGTLLCLFELHAYTSHWPDHCVCWARARWHGLKITLLYFKAASRYRIKSWYLEISSRTLHKCRTGWQKSNITIFVTKCFDISINLRRCILCTDYWQLFWDTLMRVTWSWARCCFGRMFQEMLEIQQHSYGDQAVIWVLSQPSLSGCCLHTVNHHFLS